MSPCFFASLTPLLCCFSFVLGTGPGAVLLPSYDYVIVGGGISGLVVANRLSEDPTKSILVLEAGDLDNYEEFIQVPQFVGTNIGSQYDWKLSTVPQSFLDNVTRPMPQGKVLGGGSILNAMCWNRGGIDDYDTWGDLGNNPGWSWHDLLPYFIKSENYTPVFSNVIAQEFSINYWPSKHGYNGPVRVSYPKFFYNQTKNFFKALNLLGVPTAFDPNDGTSSGAFFIPTDIHPENQTRSDARRTYYDPYVNRPNFHVVTRRHVTRVLFDGSGDISPNSGGLEEGELGGPVDARSVRLRVAGVEFATEASAARETVGANIEVIIAAGALHSAQLLQLSGVGPKPLLDNYDIPVLIDLPGVGTNLQDHYLVGTFYPWPWTAGSPNGVAFPSLPSITNTSADILNSADIQADDQYLVANSDPTVVAGYHDQKNALIRLLSSENVGAYEIISNNIGSLTVSIMHPFSRGTVEIGSSDPFDDPIIDPRYGSNPVDLQILVEALKFNRKILATPPMVELRPAQFVPPVNADDDALMQVVKNGIRTEFHPSGTCAMLPLEKGGVVDTRLVVWGTQNLRIVDAGIFPLIPAAHLQATVYAVAEKAADIIKADYAEQSPEPLAFGPSSPEPISTFISIPVTVATASLVADPGPSSEPPSQPPSPGLTAIASLAAWARKNIVDYFIQLRF
ncbi:hypothetical protein FGG08_000002 [Glutinoglossum americanum]|uniref:Glucose-methanol-choline oxidoreductase N-terminal domain-containing protein n=1 Tax=Glutinoglossum americanum TaxID=1670608 RepID=A0A9P8I4I2_9PEZI|nr:hypothetical protein FGG08_000002 [Glutinoglossum americanum]